MNDFFFYGSAVFIMCHTENTDAGYLCKNRKSLKICEAEKDALLFLKYKKSQFSLCISTFSGFSYALMCMIHSNISLHTLQQSAIVYISLDTFNRRNMYTFVVEKIYTSHMPFLHHLQNKQIFASACSINCFYYV